MIYNALNVAEWILFTARRKGISMTHMKLQKLLYYAQGYALGMTGKPLFKNKIQAWEHGPVVPDVYHVYSKYGNKNISVTEDVNIPDEYSSMIGMLIAEKGYCSASALREMTHKENAWNDAYFGNGTHTIEPKAIEKDFVSKFWCSDEEDEYQPSFNSPEEEHEYLVSGITDEERNAIIKSR